MTALLHASLYLAVAFVGWILLVVAVATLIHGRAWVWARTLEASGRFASRHRRRGDLLAEALATQPVTRRVQRR